VQRTRGANEITKAGTTLDAAAQLRLTEEAKAGYNPASLTRRHAGRPSLSGRAGHSNRVDLRVDDETSQAIRRIADPDHRNVSDIVRDAIRQFSKPAEPPRDGRGIEPYEVRLRTSEVRGPCL
jgi:hypothetical protein